MNKAIGLDVGDRRIGVAKTDALGITAQGIGVIYAKANPERTYQEIIELLDREQPDVLVVGLPRNMNGTLGPQAEKVKRFVEEILARRSIDVAYQDERLSTVSAQRVLLEGDVSRRKRKHVVDEIAAVIILQSWMDARS